MILIATQITSVVHEPVQLALPSITTEFPITTAAVRSAAAEVVATVPSAVAIVAVHSAVAAAAVHSAGHEAAVHSAEAVAAVPAASAVVEALEAEAAAEVAAIAVAAEVAVRLAVVDKMRTSAFIIRCTSRIVHPA